MQEDTKPEDEQIPDAQPKDEDIPDTKPKTPFSRSEYHGVITSYAGLALSLIAIILSVITMYQSHMMETREIVQILRAEDDGYYHFDGETLFKNFQVTVANNSAIPVSVVEITIERDGEARTFEISDLPDILPLNMESNHSQLITIPYEIKLTPENAQKLRDILINNAGEEWKSQFAESDILTPSTPMKVSAKNRIIYEAYSILYLRKLEPILGSIPPYETLDGTLSLSVKLCTAKNNCYLLNTEDIGPPESVEEYEWVIHMTILNRIEYFYEQATLNQLEGVEKP